MLALDSFYKSGKTWKDFRDFLMNQILELNGIEYKFKNILPVITGFRGSMDLGQKALNRFMNSLDATIARDASTYFTFVNLTDGKMFSLPHYFNFNTRYIGLKPFKEGNDFKFPEKAIGESGIQLLKILFDY
jgi:hypothetical protein